MKKSIFFIALYFLTLASKAQKNYFIYLQTDNKQTFSVRMDGKDLSSTASGYIIIPKLEKGEHSFTVSFPKNEWSKQNFNVLLNNNDEGYTLKNFSDKGWGLFNQQSMEIVMNGDPIKKAKTTTENTAVEIVKNTPEVKVEKVEEAPIVKVEKVTVAEKIEETPTAKVATNNANRAPVLSPTPEPEIVKTTPKIVEKTVEAIKETPAIKVEEKIVEKVKEVPIIKPEEKVIEKIKETPVVKVEEKIVEKVIETPAAKVEEKITANEPSDEIKTESTTNKSKNKITKVSSFDDIDGTTITYRVESQSGVDIVPIFLEKNISNTTEATQPKSGEKFIEHIELTNPNATKTAEESATAKVATNNANRLPVEEKVKEVVKVEAPVVEKVKEKEVVKVEAPVVEKVKEKEVVKVETPIEVKVKEVVKVETPVIEKIKEKDYGANNPLKITEVEKSSVVTMNKTKINSDCTNKNATEEDFFRTRKKIIAEDNDDARIEAALKQFKLNCYSVEQIKNLAILFLSDIGKYKLVDAAYPYTYESNLYSSLEPLFIDVYYLNRFRAMLQR